MGKARKGFDSFLDSIPDSKLTGLPKDQKTLYKDRNMRLDMQGMTSGRPQKHNLQIQVNKEPDITSLKALAPNTISTVLAPSDVEEKSASQLKKELRDNCLL